LSSRERSIVLEANRFVNIERPDYKDPLKYGAGRVPGGDNWDSESPREGSERGQLLIKLLSLNPRSVLEIGPGAGFYTKIICETASVASYTAIDIAPSFLNYIEERIKALQEYKRFSAEYICRDLSEGISLGKQHDFVILISCVHHIPNRLRLFEDLKQSVPQGGKILIYEPSHYLPRIFDLLKKCLFSGYLSKSFYQNKRNLSTHHFCTYGEFKNICNLLNGFYIEHVEYICGKNLHKKWFSKFLPLKYLSSQIGVVIVRRS